MAFSRNFSCYIRGFLMLFCLFAHCQVPPTEVRDGEGNRVFLDAEKGALSSGVDGKKAHVSAAAMTAYCTSSEIVTELSQAEKDTLRPVCSEWLKLTTRPHLPYGSPKASAKTARAFYEELYTAGGLDKMSDQYVCFRDDSEPVFFLLMNGDNLREYLAAKGTLSKMTPQEQAKLRSGMVFLTQYREGISNGRDYLFHKANDTGYTEDLALPEPGKKPFRVTRRLRINWQTLRYKLDIEQPGVAGALSSDTGKCEAVGDTVEQHGDAER